MSLCGTCCLKHFGLDFKIPLIAVDSDHLCTGWRIWLLINKWKQPGAFPSQPIREWRRPCCEGLREVGKDTQERLVPHCVCPWHTADPVPIDCQPDAPVGLGPILSIWRKLCVCFQNPCWVTTDSHPSTRLTLSGLGLFVRVLLAFQIAWHQQV